MPSGRDINDLDGLGGGDQPPRPPTLDAPSSPVAGPLVFGDFRLNPAARTFEGPMGEIVLGGRAFDLLVALVEHAGTVISHRELLARVWPATAISDGVLRVQLSALRKALGDSKRFIVSVPGRGYVFTERARPESAEAELDTAAPEMPPPRGRNHTALTGRDAVIKAVIEQLDHRRVVTLVGPGGIGKTSVAAAVAHHLIEGDQRAAHFVDLTLATEAGFLPTVIGAAVGLRLNHLEGDRLLTFLATQSCVLVFDNCEHIIAAAAHWASRIAGQAPGVTILATSREALRIPGEWVIALPPLETPDQEAAVDPDRARDFPAVRLLLDRMVSLSPGRRIVEQDVLTAAQICQRLDGVPLAIELAASRVSSFGLPEVARQLDHRLSMTWTAGPSAPARQSSLRATLGWSYDLLGDNERLSLCRLSAFVGRFGLRDATGLLGQADPPFSEALALEAVHALVSKSLLNLDFQDGEPRYRLLDITRTFASERASELGQARANGLAHARYIRDYLRRAPTNVHAKAALDGLNDNLANVRSALDWSFSPSGDLELAQDLAALSPPFFLALSLSEEVLHWSRIALEKLASDQRGGLQELALQAATSQALAFGQSMRPALTGALTASLARTVELSEKLGMVREKTRALYFMSRLTDFHNPLLKADMAERAGAGLDHDIASQAIDASDRALYHFAFGRLHQSIQHAEMALALFASVGPEELGVLDQGIAAHCRGMHSVALWYVGRPDQALSAAERCLALAAESNSFDILCDAVIWTTNVFWYRGDLGKLLPHLDEVERGAMSRADFKSRPYMQFARAITELERGNRSQAVDSLTGQIDLAGNPQLVLRIGASLADAHARAGDFDKALACLARLEPTLDHLGYSNLQPELMRLKAEALWALGPDAREDCVAVATAGKDLARQVGALSWELRIARSLAKFLMAQNQRAAAETMLGEVYERFTEGHETQDLRDARALLESARGAAPAARA